MKIAALIYVLTFLTGCTANPIKGEWWSRDSQGKTMVRIENNSECFMFTGGGIDGMGSECQYKNIGNNSYQLWFVDENGTVEENIYFALTHNKEKESLLLDVAGHILELKREQ